MKEIGSLKDSIGKPSWQKSSTIYQVWPNSFCDSNADGIGDLNGIASKLDYLKDLGIDVIWISPIYASPLADMGYDISDYRAINPLYGTMEDFDSLLQGLHKRGMKLVMDLVVNHTSTEHEWFKESRSSKTNPKRDWYFWRPPRSENGVRKEPNNWKTCFDAGPAWTYDEKTEEYYMRLYTPSQPDLNWDNTEVREAVYDLMRFWLDKGVDGFRMDVINLISKPPGLPDAKIVDPNSKYQPPWDLTANGPRVHEYLQEMNRKVLSHYDIVTVGETPFNYDVKTLAPYVLPQNKELQMVFVFELHHVDSHAPLEIREWKLSEFASIVNKWQTSFINAGGWNSVYLENHDQARSIPRWASRKPEFRKIGAKMLALFHCCCTGTLYVYQGEEFGMSNLPASWGIEEYLDVATINWWNDHLKERREKTGKENPDMSDIMEGIQIHARDHARSPVQWDNSAQAGFTTGKPWMRVNEDYKEGWNAADQQDDPDSVLSFWKQMLKFRKQHTACIYGQFKLLEPDNEDVFSFLKIGEEETLLVVANFTEKTLSWSLPETVKLASSAKPLVSNTGGDSLKDRKMGLQAFEACVYKVVE